MDNQIISSIIAAGGTLLGSIIIGFFIERYFTKVTRKNEERLARLSPTFQLQIEETRDFIKLHSEMTRIFFDALYSLPKQYLNLLLLHEHNPSEDFLNTIEELLSELENKSVKQKYHELKSKHNLFYAIYLSLIPNLLTFDLELEKAFLTKFYQNSPFISIDNQRLSISYYLNLLKPQQNLKVIYLFCF